MFKRLITCSDGTWNKPAMKDKKGNTTNSNVCYIYNAIARVDAEGIAQLKVYDTGVGSTYKFLDKFSGGLTGAGIDTKIKDSYLFLVLNYAPGDEIYLFGFSRGAYTARSLAGFIRCCGIIKPQYIHLVDKAYQLYRDRNEYSHPDSDLMRSFRSNYCYEDVTRIKFIGVWDTVGALGIPLRAWQMYNQERYMFHDTKLSSTIDYAYQALAVDEHRSKFAPVLWEASTNKDQKGTKEIEQRWFAGAHGNVGGGSLQDGLSNNTLHWMATKSKDCGLYFEEDKLSVHVPDIGADMEDSFTGIYKLSGWLSRRINDPAFAKQVIDESVFNRIKQDQSYRPKNVIPEFFQT